MRTGPFTRKVLAMKAWLIGFALLAGCTPVPNDVRVTATGFPDATGVVVLCGKHETPLRRRGDVLAAAVPIRCEGSGVARIRLKDGRTFDCPVGYVTPGARQSFDFLLGEGGCH